MVRLTLDFGWALYSLLRIWSSECGATRSCPLRTTWRMRQVIVECSCPPRITAVIVECFLSSSYHCGDRGVFLSSSHHLAGAPDDRRVFLFLLTHCFDLVRQIVGLSFYSLLTVSIWSGESRYPLWLIVYIISSALPLVLQLLSPQSNKSMVKILSETHSFLATMVGQVWCPLVRFFPPWPFRPVHPFPFSFSLVVLSGANDYDLC
ncbi:hypothetical protein M5K25_022499 [Dendrobium thyrsiflorum]|uniref:Uncharacterized protein n=1 Tax=Dendrobium thyrsiflorum TaxID=117978 RepID=A0ABD0U6E5_DENTH